MIKKQSTKYHKNVVSKIKSFWKPWHIEPAKTVNELNLEFAHKILGIEKQEKVFYSPSQMSADE